MSTTFTITTGDVIEFLDEDDTVVTALVLLAAEQNVILDRCDGSTPIVAVLDELVGVRRFEPEFADAA